MEIVTIEATVFESMLEYLENAARITDELCEKLREKRNPKIQCMRKGKEAEMQA